MLFRKSKEKLCDAKRNCATQALQFADNLTDEMLSYFDQLVAVDESNMTPARKRLHRSRIITQAQKELDLYSSKIKKLSTTAAKQYR